MSARCSGPEGAGSRSPARLSSKQSCPDPAYGGLSRIASPDSAAGALTSWQRRQARRLGLRPAGAVAELGRLAPSPSAAGRAGRARLQRPDHDRPRFGRQPARSSQAGCAGVAGAGQHQLLVDVVVGPPETALGNPRPGRLRPRLSGGSRGRFVSSWRWRGGAGQHQLLVDVVVEPPETALGKSPSAPPSTALERRQPARSSQAGGRWRGRRRPASAARRRRRRSASAPAPSTRTVSRARTLRRPTAAR
jgi:hypothetical protein